jgi:hypothetical protein
MKYYYMPGYTGNSVFNSMAQQLAQPSVIVLDQAQVDENQWYTINTDPVIAAWIRQQPKEHWYEHPNHAFRSLMDIHEHLYTMLRLRT